MNYVKQAYALSDSKKQAALQLYKEAVVELVQKDYCMQVNDAHTELSAIFGTIYTLNPFVTRLGFVECAHPPFLTESNTSCTELDCSKTDLSSIYRIPL